LHTEQFITERKDLQTEGEPALLRTPKRQRAGSIRSSVSARGRCGLGSSIYGLPPRMGAASVGRRRRRSGRRQCRNTRHCRSWPTTSRNTPARSKKRQFHHDFRGPVESLLCRQVWAVVEEDQRRSPLPFCETRTSDPGKSPAARSHVDLSAALLNKMAEIGCQGRSETRPLGRRESRPVPIGLRLCFEGFVGAAGA
jgi:hypothetical protein